MTKAKPKSVCHPMQPIVMVDGVARFKANAIVRYLLDWASDAPIDGSKCDMNDLARMPFSQEDRNQFAQLIGYSVSGFGDLSYADPRTVRRADRAVLALRPMRGKK